MSADMGCLRSTGRERLLAGFSQNPGSSATGSDFVTTADLVAFVENQFSEKYGGSVSQVRVVDLDTGIESAPFSGEKVFCQDFCSSTIDQMGINAAGFTAVHTSVIQYGYPTTSQEQVVEQILAKDDTGVHVEDTVTSTYPNGGYAGPGITPVPPSLTDPQLDGDTLTWHHDGAPRSTQLS